MLLGELWFLSPSFVALHPLDLPRMFMLYWASGIPAKPLHCAEHFTYDNSLLGRQLGLAPGPVGQALKRTLHAGRRGTGQAGGLRGEQWGKGGDAVAAQGLEGCE